MSEDSIERRLEAMKRDREWTRANPFNPVCPGCDNRENPEDLKYKVLGRMVCAECGDDADQIETGCRFRRANCKDDDCKLPVTSHVLEWFKEKIR